MNKRRVITYVVFIILVCMISYGYAQAVRNFSVDSQFGRLKSHAYPEFRIDKKKLIMGMGGQIRDANNLLILPTMLEKNRHRGYVRYQIDNMGLLHRIWFLTPEEIKLAKAEEKLRKNAK